MRLQTFVWGSAALLISSTGLSTADTPDCPTGFQVVELQPYEVICDGTTSASTRTRTYTVPFEPLGTNPPDQNGTPGPPDGPGKPQMPGQPIVPGNPENPQEPGSPPGVVTITITGTPPPLNTEGVPPPSGGFRTITKYVFPPPVPGTTTSFVPGPTPGTTIIPPAPGCSGSDCIETVVITVPGPLPSLSTRTTTTPPLNPPNTRFITTTVPGTTPGTITIPPASNCETSCVETVVITTVPTTPPNTAITLTEVCTATTSCEPITITPRFDCVRPCTTTVITYPPNRPSPTTPPPNVITTITESCTSTSSCEPVTIVPPADCVRPCTTTVITYPPNTPSPTTTPPDVITTITGTCTSTGTCEPITVPPATNCRHPCTTTVTTYPPNTPSPTTTPPDVVTTITEPCTSTGTCEPVVTVPPPSDCTRPCTTTVKVRPSTSAPVTTTPPDVITTITEPCPSTGTCEPVVTVPPPSDCTRPCTTSVFIRPSPSESLTTTTPPPDVITTITEPCPSTGTCEPVVTVPPPSDCTRPCTTSVFVRPSTSSSEAPSTTTDASSSTEEPSTTTEASSTEDSTTSQEPTTTQESTTTTESTTSQEPTTSDETTTSAESTTSAEPTTTTAPTTTDAPTTTEESTTSDAPSTTTSETPPCTPGLEWAFYNFDQAPDGETNPGQIPYHPTEGTTTWSQQTFQIATSLSGQSPDSRGITTTVGIPSQTDSFTVYGTDTGTNAAYNIVQHIGYFHPNKAGTYTFSLPNAELDDVVYTWFGDAARSGYNNGNAYYIADYYAPTARSFTYEVQNAGDYIPFRLSWVNAQDGGGFGFSVQDPDGNVVLSDSTPTTDGQFVNGCADSVDAPPFDF